MLAPLAASPLAHRASAYADAATSRTADAVAAVPRFAAHDPEPAQVRALAEAEPAGDGDLYARFERVNAGVESGGRVIASRLVTTAGAGNPASFGRAQLLVSLQVDGLVALHREPGGAERLRGFGLELGELRAMDARGRAAVAYYDAVVRGRVTAPLAASEARQLHALARRDDAGALVAGHGAAFEARTGIPADELRHLLSTRLLREPSLQAAYARLRRGAAVGEALDALAARRPEVASLRARLGDVSLDFYLTRPRRQAENRAGWYTRAVRSAPGELERLVRGLEAGADALLSARRARRDFARARALVDALPDTATAAPARRARAVALVARLQHGSPAFVLAQLGSPTAPRVASLHALEARLRAFEEAAVTTAEGDHGRSLRIFGRRFDAATSESLDTRRLLP